MSEEIIYEYVKYRLSKKQEFVIKSFMKIDQLKRQYRNQLRELKGVFREKENTDVYSRLKSTLQSKRRTASIDSISNGGGNGQKNSRVPE
ncbi:MAG: hypothetical protein ACREQ5_11845 [Candidatus Dormibacteria bacterium]